MSAFQIRYRNIFYLYIYYNIINKLFYLYCCFFVIFILFYIHNIMTLGLVRTYITNIRTIQIRLSILRKFVVVFLSRTTYVQQHNVCIGTYAKPVFQRSTDREVILIGQLSKSQCTAPARSFPVTPYVHVKIYIFFFSPFITIIIHITPPEFIRIIVIY